MLAETEGFEPSVPDLPVRRFSKPLVSATHPRLQTWPERPLGAGQRLGEKRYNGGFPARQRAMP